MTMLQSVLSALIRSGKVTVEITGMDMDELKKRSGTRRWICWRKLRALHMPMR